MNQASHKQKNIGHALANEKPDKNGLKCTFNVRNECESRAKDSRPIQ